MDYELLAIINNILRRSKRRTIRNLHLGTSLRRDLGFDSFDLAELTVRIEDRYGIDIFEGGAIDTIGDIIKKMKRV